MLFSLKLVLFRFVKKLHAFLHSTIATINEAANEFVSSSHSDKSLVRCLI